MRINLKEIENNVASISNTGSLEFVYQLLLAYGKPTSSITRLKKGDYNLAKDRDLEIYWKSNLFFKYVQHEDLHSTIDDLKGDSFVRRHNPRFIIVTDYHQLLAIDTKTEETLDIPIAEIASHFVFFLPWAGMEKAQHKTENIADIKAAERMAKLYDEIIKHNVSSDPEFYHALNVFFSRLLFCFFAEDTEVFEKSQFTKSIESHTQADGSDLHSYLDELFMALDIEDKTGYPSHIKAFPYVNGGLFNKTLQAPEFNRQARKLIIECGDLDWAQINPDIFGSMIQAVVHPGQRAGLGMHYTSVVNIMKVIEPLFLEELLELFDKSYDDKTKLQKLLGRIYGIKVFDPACGSGNFLIIAYKELRRLEHKIIERINELDGGAVTLFQMSGIQLDNFYGIEIDDFAHEVAILSLWLAKHQMNIEFKEMFNIEISLIPLKDTGNIVCGNATRIDWNKVCPNKPRDISNIRYQQGRLLAEEHVQSELIDTSNLKQTVWNEIYLIGNPPYQGAKLQGKTQKEDYKYVFGTKSFSKNLDYISLWFIKGSEYISNTKAQLAFVTTNSICQGDHVGLFWPHIYDRQVEIGFAYTSFKWTNNAKGNAGVICIIVSLRATSSVQKYLYTDNVRQSVENINAYLAPSKTNIIVDSRRKPLSNIPQIVSGSMPRDGGFLTLTLHEKNEIVEKYPEAKTYIKRYIGSQELIRGLERYCIWLGETQVENALQFPPIKDRLQKVADFRSKSDAESTRAYAKKPYRFVQISYEQKNSIVLPLLSSERREYIPINFFEENTVVSNLAFAIYDADDYIFGIISSKMSMIWIRAVGGRLKTDLRISAAITYNNFPVPNLNNKQKAMITNHVIEVLDAREAHTEKTLAELYDPDKMPEDLREAHRGLDEVVELCYRSKPFETDEERLAYLFKLYEIMTATQKELL